MPPATAVDEIILTPPLNFEANVAAATFVHFIHYIFT